ncbi:MAG: flagellar assembly protein FliH [Selenomonadaceae bacterium]|nr:flagellar assembly protein FliH [Selenomonadaceae bacterium]
MSRLIKGAIYDDEPKIVKVPVFKAAGAEAPEEEAEAPGLSQEALDNMLENIRQQEEHASQMLRQAKIEAEIVKQEAKAAADKVMEVARNRAEQIHEEARQQGYEQGVDEGRKSGADAIRQEQHQILVDANAAAERTIAEARESCKDYVIGAENIIAEMVLRIANKVLPQHFIDVPQLILPLVREALQKVKDQPHVEVRVAPDAYELVMMAQSEFQSQLEGSATLSVKSDESMQPGDCLLESPNGVVDAGLATQLKLVEQAVRNVMR